MPNSYRTISIYGQEYSNLLTIVEEVRNRTHPKNMKLHSLFYVFLKYIFEPMFKHFQCNFGQIFWQIIQNLLEQINGNVGINF